MVFANRFVVVVDACSLFGVLSRNTLLSLAEEGLFRARWSEKILNETEIALERLYAKSGEKNSEENAKRQRLQIHTAFEEATVDVSSHHMLPLDDLPDSNDAHVIETAIACDASIIVTENIKHFPDSILNPHGLEAKTADTFIADTIDLRTASSIKAISKMRERLRKPSITAEKLLLLYESRGFYETADLLRPHIDQL